jgi:diguanylate cyclase (GGDEF)-like protein
VNANDAASASASATDGAPPDAPRGQWAPSAGAGPAQADADARADPAEAAAFRLTAAGLAVIDRDGLLVRVNPAFAALHDRSPEQLTGASVLDLTPDGEERYGRPEARRVVTEPGATYEFTSSPVDRPDRSLRYVLRALPGAAEHAGAKGADAGGAGRAETVRLLLLEAAPDRSRAELLAPGPVPQLVLDRDGTVVAASATAVALLGRSDIAEVAPRPLASLLHPGDDAVVERLVSADDHRAPARPDGPLEARVLRPDGAVAWVSLQPDRSSLAERRPGATLVVLGDLTARKLDELLLHEAFDVRPQPFVMVDAAGRVLSANPAWRAAYGALLRSASPPTEVLLDLLDADGAAELAEQLASTAAGHQSFFEVHTLAAVATLHPRALHLRAFALHDLEGRVERVLIEFDDVTEPALEVEHARSSALRTRNTVDLIDQPVVTHDADGRVSEVNLGAHRVWGPGASDLIGQPGLPGWWRPAGPDGSPLDEAEHPARRVLRGEAAPVEATLQLTLPGGPTRWFAARARAVVDAGRRVGAVVAYRELTEQLAELAAVRDDSAALRAAFDALPVACYATDDALVPVLTNQAWTELVGGGANRTGQAGERGRRDDPAGSGPGAGRPPAPEGAIAPGGDAAFDLLTLAHPADRAELGAAIDRAIDRGEPVDVFHRIRRPGGPATWVQHRLTPRQLPAGGLALRDPGQHAATHDDTAGGAARVGSPGGSAPTDGPPPQRTIRNRRPGPGGVIGFVLPVPEHVALSDRTRRLLNLVENSHDLVIEYDLAESRITYLNPRARELFLTAAAVGPSPAGAPAATMPERGDDAGEVGRDDCGAYDGLGIEQLYPLEARELFRTEVFPALADRGRWEGELPMVGAGGERLQVQQWVTGEHDAAGRLVRFVSAGHDVTDRSQREAELSLRATQDALTGLGNRALLLDHLELALARARRTGQLVALVFLDLDRFKSVNDRLGHDAGDHLLCLAAERIARAVRPGDTVVRIGGDEFVALCDGVDDAAHALEIADGIVAAVGEQLYDVGGTTLRATASVGVALSAGNDHPEALLRDADAAMYRAKDLGRARLELFDETMRSRASNRIQLTEELRHAVASGAITVHYQPSIDLRTGRVRSVESLARWQHPERGLLQPGEFIGVADSSGLVLELGLEVLRQACRMARSWQDRWGAAAPRMHVNLSGRQVADPELARLVAYVLAETRVDPALICLELTESILLDDSEATIEAIRGLKDLGISLAIDDFGTGYSSLSYLSRLPVDVVKVDKAFVDDLDPADGDGPVVAAAIISLARTLGLATIAEGVTTVVQLAELHRLGCDAAQGYYFSPPLDARAIEIYLERRLSDDADDLLPPSG